MKIPIQNLYYLLVYAWDVLDESHVTEVGASEINVPSDLFGRILLNGIDHLVKRGLDRSYTELAEEIPGVRGHIDISASIKQLSFTNGKLVCEFDELTHDVIHNQILKATLRKLCRTSDMDSELKRELYDLIPRFSDVSDISISSEAFRRVQLHRNNGAYRMLIHVCRMLDQQLLPEQKGAGYKFVEFSEEQLSNVFETFVRNFYRKEQKKYRVSKDRIRWQQIVGDEISISYLPVMETDVTLISDEDIKIVETKFYKTPLIKRADSESEKIRSAHLYQLFSYIQNMSAKESVNVGGILLYAQSGDDFLHEVECFGHGIKVATVDLTAPP